MLVVIVLIIGKREEFIAHRIRKLAQRFAHPVSDTPSAVAFGTLGGHPNNRREERRCYLFCSQFDHRRIINEKRVPGIVRDRPDDAFRPRMAYRGEEHLE